MSPEPKFSFYISDTKRELFPGCPLWEQPLPGKGFDPETSFPIQGPAPSDSPLCPPVTVGEYFLSARSFLLEDCCRVLRAALPGQDPEPGHCSLFLVKHGAFYHPLKVNVELETGSSISLVLNGAVAEPGLSLVEKEYDLLSRFSQKKPQGYTPPVFGAGAVTQGGHSVRFFLGQWFDEYEEFHISDHDGQRQVAVWGQDGDIAWLPLERAGRIYENIARVLTFYYDFHTFDQIFSWHLAAGDFVVNPLDPVLPVRLISIRGYEPLTRIPPEAASEDSEVFFLVSLLFFFLSLTLGIRLDRLDGTGDVVFLDDSVLSAGVAGFLSGLAEKSLPRNGHGSGRSDPRSGRADDPARIFTSFIKGFSQEQILAVMEEILDSWKMSSRESRLIKEHMEAHSAAILRIFKNI